MALVQEVFEGAKTLLVGMKITWINFWRPSVTSPYPMQKIEMSKAFRNVIVLIRKEDIQSHDCIACKACERVCPSFCIKVEGERPENMRRLRATEFKVDFALCSDCGLCLDVCPTETLGYSKVHDAAGYHRSDSLFDLLDPWREEEPATIVRLRAEEEIQAAQKIAKKAKKTTVKKDESSEAENDNA